MIRSLITSALLGLGLLLMSSCSDEDKAERARDLVGDRVLIILAKQPHLDSHVLDIQDYIREGKSFVPFFSSGFPLSPLTKMSRRPSLRHRNHLLL